MATADPGRPADEARQLAETLGLSPGEAAGTLARREVARRLLEARDAPIARLAADHAIEAFAFARTTAPATLAGLADSLKHPAKPDDPSARRPTGSPRWPRHSAPTSPMRRSSASCS